MKNTMWDIEIKMMIPFDTLAVYPNDDNDEYNIEPTFVKIMELLNVEFDVRRIVETLYRYRSGKSAIEVQYSLDSFDEFIILDAYIGLTDQLDFIYMMFRSKGSKGGELRELTHRFYTDTCNYNVEVPMNYTILTELLYVGFCFEKGRVYTNYWKPWYKKKLKSQVEIWRKLICIIDKPNLGKEDFMIIEELKKMCSVYEFIHYDAYTSHIEYTNFNNILTSSFSTKQKEIIKFIMVLLEDLQRVLKGYRKKKMYSSY